jgi:hypothetical protein
VENPRRPRVVSVTSETKQPVDEAWQAVCGAIVAGSEGDAKRKLNVGLVREPQNFKCARNIFGSGFPHNYKMKGV